MIPIFLITNNYKNHKNNMAIGYDTINNHLNSMFPSLEHILKILMVYQYELQMYITITFEEMDNYQGLIFSHKSCFFITIIINEITNNATSYRIIFMILIC